MNVIRGETKPFVFLIQGRISRKPFDFTGATEIVVSFPKDGGATIDYKLSLAQISYPVDAKLGALAGTIVDSDSPTLNLGQGQQVKIVATLPSGTKIWEGAVVNVSD